MLKDLGIKNHLMLGICFGSGERQAGQGMEMGGMAGGGILCEGNGMSRGQRWDRASDVQTPANTFDQVADSQDSGALTLIILMLY